MTQMTIAVVIPVRGHSSLLDGCLDALRQQTKAPNQIVVVDDSAKGSLVVPDDVTLLRSGGVGPYAARNLGWRAIDADLVFFTDARSRPRPEWAERTAEMFIEPSVAFAGGQTQVVHGSSWAARVAHDQQIFAVENYVQRSAFKVYFPTCNLAVRRSVLTDVDGFAAVRSGADADLCWRIQQDEGRTYAATNETLMDWVPRDDLVEYIEQYYRYGKSNWGLRRAWQERGAEQANPPPLIRLLVRTLRLFRRMLTARARRDEEATLEQLGAATTIAYAVGLRTAQLREALTDSGRRLGATAHDLVRSR
jgi:glycosyltransferase involved in cell wall biosynthesis